MARQKVLKSERIQIVGRRARRLSPLSELYAGGYTVIHYLPDFGGRKEYGTFMYKKYAEKFARRIKRGEDVGGRFD